jgi:pyruvate carboxylase subunit B
VVAEGGAGFQASPLTGPAPVSAPVVEGTDVDAPTPGNIVKVLVEVGDTVAKDATLVIMEAMKMESEIKAPQAGKIVAVHVSAGDTVQTSEPLVTIA